MPLEEIDETLYQMWMDGMCAGAYQKLQKIVPEYRMPSASGSSRNALLGKEKQMIIFVA